jgi:hypothetical protein
MKVRRTSTGGSIPVYVDYKNGNTRAITIVRNLNGDIEVSACSLLTCLLKTHYLVKYI